MTTNYRKLSVSLSIPEYQQTSLKTIDSIPEKALVAIDLETTKYFPQEGRILLVIMCYDNTIYALTIEEYLSLKNKNKWIYIGHNLTFDNAWLQKEGFFMQFLYDTSIIEKLLNNNPFKENFALTYILEKYLGITIDKTFRNNISDKVNMHDLVKYAESDVIYLHALLDKQLALITQYDMHKAVIHECRFTRTVAYSQLHGVRLDCLNWRNLYNKNTTAIQKYEKELFDYIKEQNWKEFIEPQLTLFNNDDVCALNWNAPDDRIKFVSKFNIKVMSYDKKVKKEKDSSSSALLKPYVAEYPILDALIKHTKTSKSCGTFGLSYLEAALNFPDHRIRTCFNTVLTSGRLSSGETANQQEKINRQFRTIPLVNILNIPKNPEFRQCFIPNANSEFIIFDYGGQETRILADFSKDPVYYDYIVNPENDIHCFMAKLLYDKVKDKSYAEIKEHYPKLRDIAKRAVFALAYGGNYMNIHINCNVDLDVAKAAESAYYEKFNGLKKYFDATFMSAVKHEYILINSVYKRKVFLKEAKQKYAQYKNRWNLDNHTKQKVGYWFKETMKACKNLPIQGTGADMLKESTRQIWEYAITEDLLHTIKFPIFMHDELVLETDKNYTEMWYDFAKNAMLTAATLICPSVPFTVEGHIGNSWASKSKNK